ncbi:ArnT family glycosyltransferase [Hufsiella ginkgonis]|uniref:Phospholipid carrier-dependent glycosyltransferase n=1 Tax=Hufsiella ginkgonis TaxID=2695274 RepID=A0A7K1XZA9_9SPHI|nr:glycosyltransferase family 39 protein [Hufsiella ginkgonis]MXV15886.1 phospholipid carrier-dependent glycosyltransferase [Hufsiella ginkgonis]
MSIFRRNLKEARLILLFTCLKLVIHLAANSNFGFHRDELLYLALGDHLDWGFKEVPPFIAFISWLSGHLFGDSVFASRLIPSIAGAFIVYLTGLMVVHMGGKRFAVSAACIGVILSPAFLASQYLLQPVVFDQLFWTLAAYFMVKYIQTKKITYLYCLGVACGIGMLNKYTMLLYGFSLFVGLLISSQRKMLFNRHVIGAMLVALLLFLPNLLWQISHDFPVLAHMRELKKTQLEYVDPFTFLLESLMIHATGLLIWIPGMVYLFASRVKSKFTFISYAFVTTMVVLLLLHGKVYYGFGAYPALFAAGGLAWDRVMTRLTSPGRYTILGACLVPALLFVPIAIPVLSLPVTVKFFAFASEKMDIDFPLRWEDQQMHATTQDYADMLGWNEITDHVEKAYSLVSAADKKFVTIFAENYGMAGAIDHLGKKYLLPKAVSFNSSYLLWAPASIEPKYLIYVSEARGVPRVSAGFKSFQKVGEVLNPYAREKGASVYLLWNPLDGIRNTYEAKLKEARSGKSD